jgi:hypothetical protein
LGTTSEVDSKVFVQFYQDYSLEMIGKVAKEQKRNFTIDGDDSIASVQLKRISAHEGRPLTYQLSPSIADGKTVRINCVGQARQSFIDTWEMTVTLIKAPPQ